MAVQARTVQNKRDQNVILTGKAGPVYDVNIKYNVPKRGRRLSRKIAQKLYCRFRCDFFDIVRSFEFVCRKFFFALHVRFRHGLDVDCVVDRAGGSAEQAHVREEERTQTKSVVGRSLRVRRNRGMRVYVSRVPKHRRFLLLLRRTHRRPVDGFCRDGPKTRTHATPNSISAVFFFMFCFAGQYFHL
jgi:hypothetical protein